PGMYPEIFFLGRSVPPKDKARGEKFPPGLLGPITLPWFREWSVRPLLAENAYPFRGNRQGLFHPGSVDEVHPASGHVDLLARVIDRDQKTTPITRAPQDLHVLGQPVHHGWGCDLVQHRTQPVGVRAGGDVPDLTGPDGVTGHRGASCRRAVGVAQHALGPREHDAFGPHRAGHTVVQVHRFAVTQWKELVDLHPQQLTQRTGVTTRVYRVVGVDDAGEVGDHDR